MMRRLAIIFAFLAGLAPANGAYNQQQTWGSTSTGAPNAQAVTIGGLLSKLSDLTGVTVSFTAGFTNQGATTLVVNSGPVTLPPTPVDKITPIGLAALTGEEIIAGAPSSVMYNGTVFVLLGSNADGVGSLRIASYNTLDPGYLWADGSCKSTTTYAVLFAKIGDKSGGTCGAGQFGLPDIRSRSIFGWDDLGTSNRLTTAISGIDGTMAFAAGGLQGIAGGIPQTDLAPFNFTGTFSAAVPAMNLIASETTGGVGSGGTNFITNGFSTPLQPGTPQTSIVFTNQTVPNGGGGNAFSTTPPAIVMPIEIRY